MSSAATSAPPSDDDLASWFAAAQTGKGTPLLDAEALRALTEYACDRDAVIDVVETYRIDPGDIQQVVLDYCIFDDLSENLTWPQYLRVRYGEVLSRILLTGESGDTFRFQVWVRLPEPASPDRGSLTVDQLLDQIEGFAGLLEACVAEGASLGFLHPMAKREAERYWRGVIPGVAAGDVLLWALFDDEGPIATIQLHPVGKPNGAHRAEIAKLMVHPRARGRGLAKQLMETAEQAACDMGRRLLVLDTVEDGVAHGLYRQLGWTEAGKIPDFALKSGGGSEATVVFWKAL